MRWYAELDLRALKQTMQMDILRCQSPDMVRKEVWAHLLAYNLLRGLMARAAEEAGLLPLQVSFKGSLQLVQAFAAVLWTAEVAELEEIMRRLREAMRTHRVGDRPNRCEPRKRKRRPSTTRCSTNRGSKPEPVWAKTVVAKVSAIPPCYSVTPLLYFKELNFLKKQKYSGPSIDIAAEMLPRVCDLFAQ